MMTDNLPGNHLDATLLTSALIINVGEKPFRSVEKITFLEYRR